MKNNTHCPLCCKSLVELLPASLLECIDCKYKEYLPYRIVEVRISENYVVSISYATLDETFLRTTLFFRPEKDLASCVEISSTKNFVELKHAIQWGINQIKLMSF